MRIHGFTQMLELVGNIHRRLFLTTIKRVETFQHGVNVLWLIYLGDSANVLIGPPCRLRQLGPGHVLA